METSVNFVMQASHRHHVVPLGTSLPRETDKRVLQEFVDEKFNGYFNIFECIEDPRSGYCASYYVPADILKEFYVRFLGGGMSYSERIEEFMYLNWDKIGSKL